MPKNLGYSNWILSVAWSPDGQTLASGSQDRTIKLWDVIQNPILIPTLYIKENLTNDNELNF